MSATRDFSDLHHVGYSIDIYKGYDANMPRTIAPIRTKRFLLRALNRGDFDYVFGILSDPNTVAGRSFKKDTMEEVESWLSKRIMDEEKLGYSMWAVERNSKEIIGLCGFFGHDFGAEIGYVIKSEFQGQGFGTEVASAAIVAAKNAGLSVFATIRPSNVPSTMVAEKSGLVKSREKLASCPELDLYRSN